MESMNLTELKQQPPSELIVLSESLGLDGLARSRKQDVIFEILKAQAKKGEDIYKTEYAGRTLSDAEWIEAMARHPILIERPIVIRGSRAVIGRPPENALDLL